MRTHLSTTSWLLAGTMALCMTACDDSSGERKTVLEVKRMYATKFVEGVEYGLAGVIKADRVDAETYDLIDIRVDDGDRRMLHADRAELLVDTANDTLQLQLRGIVSADADVGHIVTSHGTITEPIKLGFDVVP